MSFHGGFLGVCVAVIFFARKHKIELMRLADFVAPVTPIGLFLGRIGNFIGQELWGRPTEGWWAMVFPEDPLQFARHPSQLYEAALEGILLFIILWVVSQKQRTPGVITGLFLIGYGFFRFLVEFAREPDAHLADSLLFSWMTRGQQLCVPMILIGVILIIYVTNKATKEKDSKA
ncbi:UNVERIFIED_CONTAM: hypothetical protein GTU68_054763 [Idotea baltica]|nr:hypothetical protein [Idotea baltica]